VTFAANANRVAESHPELPAVRFKQVLSAALISVSLAAPLCADSVYGDILAGREALNDYDFAAAERHFGEALAAHPDNLRFADALLTAQTASGHFDKALPVAQALAAQGEKSPILGLTLLVDAITREDWPAVKALIADGHGPVPQLEEVFLGWAEVGLGNMDAALQHFDTLGRSEGTEVMGFYHRGFALALAGDFAGAYTALTGPQVSGVLENRRGILIRAELLALLDRNPEALDLITTRLGLGVEPPLDAFAARLTAGEPVTFTFLRTARDGLAETLFTTLSALDENTPAPYVLAIAQAAIALNPAHSDARLVAGDLLANMGRHDEAIAIYNSIPAGDFSSHLGQLGMSAVLVDADRTGEAITVLTALSATYPNLMEAHVNLGDINRREDRNAEAVAAYDRAIALFRSPDDEDWRVYFYRGICYEQLKDWAKAEPDFRKSLALNPDQPQVLNYLGYSYVEQKTNLDEALDLIARAVRLSPDSGYIVDSLGWALYRLGRYEEAVAPMERAAHLTATDPVVNDHLGDVYWAVGRKREARFQWERALSFEPEQADLKRIQRKLEVGLDEVLAEEGAPPTVPPSVPAGGL
jgi:tetratricopeptide (TPR) repeat protein